MRIYLANIGANSNHRGLFSPLFADGRFELLPIPEGVTGLNGASDAVHYRQLRSYYHPDRDLGQYVPENLWSTACHHDPEFETYTYGDNGTNGRSSALTQMQSGDVLLFLARLEGWDAGRRTGENGFYLIGGLLVDYADWIDRRYSQWGRFARNAHAIRGGDIFWGIAGSNQSRRFERAVPITRVICEQVFRAANGRLWDWSKNTEMGTIGSYTRACRCVLDTNDSGMHRRAAALQEWIARHTGSFDAEMLAAVS